MATLKWCPPLYINLSSWPAGGVIFGLLQPYCSSWFMHLICFVGADSAAVNEWLNGEEAGWGVTSRVAATLINSLGFILLHLFKRGSALSSFQLKSPREILIPGQVGLVHSSPLWVSTSPLATRLMILASIWCRWPQWFFILEEELTARDCFLSISLLFFTPFLLTHFRGSDFSRFPFYPSSQRRTVPLSVPKLEHHL